ncbi:hypothetical protein LTR70_003410 [Exophiala xenobiotica]|uniref:Uncharacterized protein n=1 Tax=Lithohypha guttulata TaxID=1690604 RepID=A0ABR0KGE5_9EURO|nr:hypothetical protein LTR24_002957 [Lithohypha guttulata]KAK5323548.1 hypothetical protein LTR70_003410 [Exophiala xenobiotica]
MSAPNEGRQSPPPQDQSDAQAGKTAGGKLDKSEDKNEDKENQLEGLESNPKHILEDEADKKTSKTMN